MNNELPKLEGTEKQVKWAEDIREKIIAEYQKIIMEDIVEDIKESDPVTYNERVKEFELIKSQASAEWWINNRRAIGGSVVCLSELIYTID